MTCTTSLSREDFQRVHHIVARLWNEFPRSIHPLAGGRSNRSYVVHIHGQNYVVRLHDDHDEKRRAWEGMVHQSLAHHRFLAAEEVVAFSEKEGYKVSRYLEGTRVCNPDSPADRDACMETLRILHTTCFAISDTQPSIWEVVQDYEQTLQAQGIRLSPAYIVMRESIRAIHQQLQPWAHAPQLVHFDTVPENFLIHEHGKASLIDWEYARFFDPYIDVALFCLHAGYTEEQCYACLASYEQRSPSVASRCKLYVYMAIGSLLWILWETMQSTQKQ